MFTFEGLGARHANVAALLVLTCSWGPFVLDSCKENQEISQVIQCKLSIPAPENKYFLSCDYAAQCDIISFLASHGNVYWKSEDILPLG